MIAIVLSGLLSGCQKAPANKPDPKTNETACVDRWLEKRGLDRFGSAQGTMYAGGTPLFDEATGRTTDRLEFVYSNHPGAKKECAP